MRSNSRPILLAVISIISIMLFLSVNATNNWFIKKVTNPLSKIPDQLSSMEIDERIEARYGSSYIVSKSIADYIRSHFDTTNAVVLLPPAGYLKHYKSKYLVPEPVVFYYYTGMQAKWVNSSDVRKSNFAMIFQDGRLQLAPLDKEQLEKVLSVFRKYKTVL